jgi:transcriptional regulator with XRE-family HTH domain
VVYAGEHITAALKAAREEKGFSQRELSAKTGVPQSHISKIEQGAVDLQLSSLIELARVLDLEIMTVPRKLVPAVQAIVRGESTSLQGPTTLQALNELKQIQDRAQRLHFADRDIEKWRRFQQTVNDLTNLHLAKKDIEQIRSLSRAFKTLREDPKAYEEFLRAARKLQQLRNTIAHRPSDLTSLPAVRPAYTLDEGDDA